MPLEKPKPEAPSVADTDPIRIIDLDKAWDEWMRLSDGQPFTLPWERVTRAP